MKKKRILIVDDEVSFTRLFGLNLAGPYQVRVENSAVQALATALEFKPDLIFLDVMMPDGDGGAIAAQMQAHPDLRRVPIVFLTAAVAKPEVSGHGGMIGGLPFLAKPVAVSEIRECVERYLGK